jgi:hypothetical protein
MSTSAFRKFPLILGTAFLVTSARPGLAIGINPVGGAPNPATGEASDTEKTLDAPARGAKLPAKKPSAPTMAPVPGEADSPCNGETIRPDSTGNFNFSFTPAMQPATGGISSGFGAVTGYSIQFSKNGVNWNDQINEAMKLNNEKGPVVPVNAGTLLIVSKNWYWRVTTQHMGGLMKSTPGKRACKFAIEPSGGAQALTAPILVSPVCNSNSAAGTVLFDAKPGAGKFQIFRAELQYNPAVGTALGTWHASNLLTEVDKTNPGSKFGVAIPVQTLSSAAARWRWRARLYNEKMPIFGNSTTATWSAWCQFTVPSHTAQLKGGPGTLQQGTAVVPPQGGIKRAPTPASATPRLPAVQR